MTVTLDKWLEVEKKVQLEKFIRSLFLPLSTESRDNLMKMPLISYEFHPSSSKDIEHAHSELVQTFYSLFWDNYTPGTYSTQLNRVFFVRELRKIPETLSPAQEQYTLSEILQMTKSYKLVHVLLMTGVSLALREGTDLKPFEGRMATFVIDNEELYMGQHSISGRDIKIKLQLIPVVLFSPRIYDEGKEIGLSLRAKYKIRCEDTLETIYHHKLGRSQGLLKQFMRDFKRYKVLMSALRRSFAFEIIEETGLYRYDDELAGRISSQREFFEYCDVELNELEDQLFVEVFPYSLILRHLYGHGGRGTMLLPISMLKLLITMEEGARLSIRIKRRRKSKCSLSKLVHEKSSLGNKLTWVNKFIEILNTLQPIRIGDTEIAFERNLKKFEEVIVI